MVEFPESGQNVSGHRLDKLNITARLVGAPPWVEQSDVEYLFGRWGKVTSSKRGTSSRSVSSGREGCGGQAGSGTVSGW